MIVIAVVTLVSALTVGGVYTVHKVNQLQNENESIKTELQEQKQETEDEVVMEEASTTEEAVNEVEATTTTEVVVVAEQKRISVPTKIAPSVKPVTIVDVCLNIEGTQTSVPVGYISDLEVCTLSPVIDRCSNISGSQPSIPAGMVLDKEYGCMDEEDLDEIYEKRNAEESQVEYCEETKDEVQRLSVEALDIRHAYDIKIQNAYSAGGGLASGVNAEVANLQRQMGVELEPVEYERDRLNIEYVMNCT